MLYLDYSCNAGEWCPNVDGGNHNYEAISPLKRDQRGGKMQVPPRHDHRFGRSPPPLGFRPTFPAAWLGFMEYGLMHDTLSYTQKGAPSTAVTTTTT